MVTAENDGENALLHNVGDSAADLIERLLQIGRNGKDIADIDHVELLAKVHAVFEVVGAKQVRCSTNALWTESGAWSIRRAGIERRTEDCHLGIVDVMNILQERAL